MAEGPRDPSGPTWKLSVTDLSQWVSQNQCGKFVRLTSNAQLGDPSRDLLGQELVTQSGLTEAEARCSTVDPAYQEAGRQMELLVSNGLHTFAPSAPYLDDPPQPGYTSSQTPWSSFMQLLQRAHPPPEPRDLPAAGRAHSPDTVGCWAAEVQLRCIPVPGSPVELSGRADFVVLLWRGGRPVLRIVECKASSDMQTKFEVQVVCYVAMVQQLLRAAGQVEIGGRRWAPEGVAVECALCVKGVGRQQRQRAAEGCGDLDGLTGPPLPSERAYSIQQLLRSWLAADGPVPLALDPSLGSLHRLPHSLGEHCATCKAAPRCWADTATRGSLPLAGVTATQAAALEAAGVTNIRELAVAEARGVRVQGIPPHELRRMALVASTRLPWHEQALAAAGATSGQGSGQEPHGQAQQQQGVTPAALAAAAAPARPCELLPGAGRTRLPAHSYFHVCYPTVRTEVRPLTRVYLAVAWDPVQRRVGALAAHVASLHAEEEADVMEVMRAPGEGAGEAGWSPLTVPDGQWDAAEAEALCNFVQRLVDQFAAVSRSRLRSLRGRMTDYSSGIALHFYFNARGDWAHLVSRCEVLTAQLEAELSLGPAAGGGGGAGGARGAQARQQVKLIRFLRRLLTMHPIIPEECQKVRDGPLAGQGMVSVVEEEVARYATPWVGAGLQAATAVDWMGEGPGRLFNWELQPPAGDSSSGSSSSSSSSSSDNDGTGLHTWVREKDRLVSGLYMRSVWPVGQQSQGQGQGQQEPGRVQLRPDIPGAHLPPSLIWRAWQHGEEWLLVAVLRSRTRALRWLEERLELLVRLEPSGSDRQWHSPDTAHLVKRQLDLGQLMRECTWDERGVGAEGRGRGLLQGAMEVCMIERDSELVQFRGELLRTPPAVRAREGRGAVVVGSLQKRHDEKGKQVLVGRVLWPQGCSSWQDVEEATGLAQDESVLLTLTGPDPEQCQGPERATAKHCVLAVITPLDLAAAAAAGSGGVWVTLRHDERRYPDEGMPLLGTPDLSLHGLLEVEGPGAMLAADTAPNISSWVAEAVLKRLHDAMAGDGSGGGGDAHGLLDRLALPADLAAAAKEAEDAVSAGAQATAATAAGSAAAPGQAAAMRLLSMSRTLDGDQEGAVRAFARGPTAGPLAPGGPGAAGSIITGGGGSGGGVGLEDTRGVILLLQGPPGTGKTETAATALLQWLATAAPEAGGLVLVSGPTHAAINVVLIRLGELLQQVERGAGWRLQRRVQLVRVGKESKPGPAATAARDAMRKLGIKMAATRPNDKAFDRSYGNWVVAGGTTRHLLTSMQPNSASLLLLDEASMMAGPQYLALITLLRAHAPLLTAGDHRQLGVISQHDFAADRRPAVVRFRAYLSAYDYTRLLCRAPGSSAVSCALSYTHRLPATLRELLAPEYAQDGITLRGRPPKALLPLSSAAGGSPWEALWVQGGGPGGPGEATEGVFLVVYDEAASGRTNALELELVRLIMEASPWHAKQQQQQRQAGGGGGGGSVALITPHRAQRRQLQRLVRAWGWAPAGCRVDTVDKMQGGEADTVIFCATASDPSALASNPAFYANISRAVVAFSRARCRLIVLAGRQLLTHTPSEHSYFKGMAIWQRLAAQCEVRGRRLGQQEVQVQLQVNGQQGVQQQQQQQVQGTSYLCQVFQAVPGGQGVQQGAVDAPAGSTGGGSDGGGAGGGGSAGRMPPSRALPMPYGGAWGGGLCGVPGVRGAAEAAVGRGLGGAMGRGPVQSGREVVGMGMGVRLGALQEPGRQRAVVVKAVPRVGRAATVVPRGAGAGGAPAARGVGRVGRFVG